MAEQEQGNNIRKEVESTPNQVVTTKEQNNEQKQTSVGLTENVGAMLCYIFVIGLVFLFIEKKSQFIRFHAFQAVFTAVAIFLINIVFSFIPVVGYFVSLLLSPLSFALMIFMMYQAYQGKEFKLPFIGDLSESQIQKA
ncbi:DUF4870 domain-containing protein [Sporosarcina sp. USHLN248]|uniref:DUF4870 domain-containing protein n=1 Tax=Sporosarcina sp. USHLN248 TaxID=3081300 RepID=UPI0030178D20